MNLPNWNRFILFFTTSFFILFSSSAQDGVGIGTEDVNTDAVLEIDSNTKGLLIPRMTSTQRLATGATSAGLIVYDTSFKAFYYYDGSIWLRLVAQPAQVDLDMDSHKIINVTNGTASKDAVNKGQLDTKLNLSGGTMSGNIAMGNRKVTGMAQGTAGSDAVNRTQLNTKLNLSGGTMSGVLNMGNQEIQNLNAGESDNEAVNYGQVKKSLHVLFHQRFSYPDILADHVINISWSRSVGVNDYMVIVNVTPTSSANYYYANDNPPWAVYDRGTNSCKISSDGDRDYAAMIIHVMVVCELEDY